MSIPGLHPGELRAAKERNDGQGVDLTLLVIDAPLQKADEVDASRRLIAITDGEDVCPAVVPTGKLPFLLEPSTIIVARDYGWIHKSGYSWLEICDAQRVGFDVPWGDLQLRPIGRPQVPPRPICSMSPTPSWSQRSGAGPAVTPPTPFRKICELLPGQGDWELKVRVVQMTQMQKRNRCSYFAVVLRDENDDQIRAAFFGPACQYYFPRIRIGDCYRISQGQVKVADPEILPTRNCYTLQFREGTTVERVHNDSRIPPLAYHFLGQLSDIGSHTENEITDIIGVILHVWPPRQGHENKLVQQADICDRSGVRVRLTMWEDRTTLLPDDSVGQVIRIKDAKITIWRPGMTSGGSSDYDPKQRPRATRPIFELTLGELALMDIDPDIPVASQLHRWWEQTGTSISFRELEIVEGDVSPTVGHLRLIEDQNLVSNKTSPDYLTVYCILAEVPVQSALTYPTCSNPNCTGQRCQGPRGNYSCNYCKRRIPDPIPKFAFRFTLMDFSGSATLKADDDDRIGKVILGVTPQEWETQLAESDGTPAAIKRLANANVGKEFKVICKVHEQSEKGGRKSTNLIATWVEPIDYAATTRFFQEETDKLMSEPLTQGRLHGHLMTLAAAFDAP